MPEVFRGFAAVRFGAMAGVAATLTAFFLYVFGVIAEAPKAILYSGLEPRETASVIAKLDAINVPYEQRGDGGTILVPSDQAARLRMQLAAEGIPSAGVGYEIFDKTDSFGITAFQQNINRLRALEGELSRTIGSLDQIESARVHLVIPDRQVFARDNQPPSASIVVKARARLSRGQVSAIQHLVAAAVPGLTPAGVAIVDDLGTLLAGGEGEGDAAIASTQEERSTAYEDRLRQRVESIVASIVGPGHARIQVSADMDYNRVTQTTETFDPDGRVVRSSQTRQEDAQETNRGAGGAASVAAALPGQAGAGAAPNSPTSANTRTEETINYEISKSTKTQVQDAGTVKKLSVAVVVDGTYTAAADGTRTYAPRSAEDMTNITQLVRSAIGYNEQRGDQLQVSNMRFAEIDTGPSEPPAEPLLGIDSAIWFKIAQVSILSITALLVFLLVVRPMIARLLTPPAPSAHGAAMLAAGTTGPAIVQQGAAGESQGQVSGGGAPGQAHPTGIPAIDTSQIDGQMRESAVRKVGDVVQNHPEEAIAIVRAWLHQPA